MFKAIITSILTCYLSLTIMCIVGCKNSVNVSAVKNDTTIKVNDATFAAPPVVDTPLYKADQDVEFHDMHGVVQYVDHSNNGNTIKEWMYHIAIYGPNGFFMDQTSNVSLIKPWRHRVDTLFVKFEDDFYIMHNTNSKGIQLTLNNLVDLLIEEKIKQKNK